MIWCWGYFALGSCYRWDTQACTSWHWKVPLPTRFKVFQMVGELMRCCREECRWVTEKGILPELRDSHSLTRHLLVTCLLTSTIDIFKTFFFFFLKFWPILLLLTPVGGGWVLLTFLLPEFKKLPFFSLEPSPQICCEENDEKMFPHLLMMVALELCCHAVRSQIAFASLSARKTTRVL